MPSELSNRVRSTREARGLSQAALARLARIAQPSLSQIESGQTASLRGTTLLKLAQALQVDPEWIQSGKGAGATDRPAFHDEEQALRIFRKLGPFDRARWLAIGQTLLDHSPDEFTK